MIRDQDALDYHQLGRPGKLEVVSTKPCLTQRDLSLAYTPGVAAPCLRIHDDPDEAYAYTGRGNLVAVVSNGTAVLGLGDIGPLAGKPVMEGKAVLFKRFADIDVFDLEVASHDVDEIVRLVELLEPTFGGINLEDIKAPECFEIESRLKRSMSIPVFHDDQHGTAIISGAALLNALELAGKRIEDVRVVFNGAGAAGIACAQYYLSLGVRRENLVLCDSAGVVYKGRERGMNPFKEELAAETNARTLAEAFVGADVFAGLSIADCVTAEMVRSMAEQPILFAMANPNPEITYEEVIAARPDAIMATGRSDYPNQVNNVLGFPFIFRGALDVRASAINEEMKLAATQALAKLAREDVPDSVMKAYGLTRLRFGREYLIPKPFDPRVLLWEATAVARAAMESGVARVDVDLDEYRERLERRLGRSGEVMRVMINRGRRAPRRVVYPEGEQDKVLRAVQIVLDEGFAVPVLLGDEARIRARIEDLNLHFDGIEIITPENSPRREDYALDLHQLRQRKGISLLKARRMVLDPTVFGALMVRRGDADALIGGVDKSYADTLRTHLQIVEARPGVRRVAGYHIMVLKDRVLFFADTTVNVEPTAEELADIAIEVAAEARRFHVEPRVAMLSYSNFGSTRDPRTEKVARATELVRERMPDLMIDGEMQADTAVVSELRQEVFPFSRLEGSANVLIFPELQSANAAYKLVQRLGGAEAIGPILIGMNRPVHVLQQGSEVRDIVYMSAIAVVESLEPGGAARPTPDLPELARRLGAPVTV